MFGFDTEHLPEPFDPGRVVRTFETMESEGAVFEGVPREVLEAAFGNSPYLSRLAVRERAMLPELFASGPDAIVERTRRDALSPADSADMNEAMRRLRVAQPQAALAIPLTD